MQCKSVQEFLVDFIEGEELENRQAMQAHMETCVSCQGEYRRLEQDLERLKARRKELIPDDEEWISFLPGIRRKITMREARRMSWLPVKRLAPVLVLMAVILILFKVKFPATESMVPLDGSLLGDVSSLWISDNELHDLTQLELYEDDLYNTLMGEDDAEVLQVIDNWQTDRLDVIDQLIELTDDEQRKVFEQLAQGLL